MFAVSRCQFYPTEVILIVFLALIFRPMTKRHSMSHTGHKPAITIRSTAVALIEDLTVVSHVVFRIDVINAA